MTSVLSELKSIACYRHGILLLGITVELVYCDNYTPFMGGMMVVIPRVRISTENGD